MADEIKVKVTAQGLEIPKQLLADFKALQTTQKELDYLRRQSKITSDQQAQGLKEVDAAAQKLNLTHRQYVDLSAQAFQITERTKNSFTSMSGAIKGINPAMMSFSQTLQDSSMFSQSFGMGIRSITNNVQMLGQQILFMKSSGNTFGSIFSGMLGAMWGPMGILVAFSAVTTAIDYFSNSTKGSKKEVIDHNEKLEKQASILKELYKELSSAFPNDKRVIQIIFDIKKSIGGQIEDIDKQIAEETSKNGEALFLFGQPTRRSQLLSERRDLQDAYSQEIEKLKEHAKLVKEFIQLAQAADVKQMRNLFASGAFSINEIDDLNRAITEQYKAAKIGSDTWKRYAVALELVAEAQEKVKKTKGKTPKDIRDIGQYFRENDFKLVNKIDLPMSPVVLPTQKNDPTYSFVTNLRLEMQELGKEFTSTTSTLNIFKSGMVESTYALSNTFFNIIKDFGNLGQTLQNFGQTVIDIMIQMAAEAAARGVVGSVLRFFTGSGKISTVPAGYSTGSSISYRRSNSSAIAEKTYELLANSISNTDDAVILLKKAELRRNGRVS